MKKNRNKILIVTSLLLLIYVVLFSTSRRSTKLFSPDKQYSVYAETYIYSGLLCALFSIMDCSYAGKIYLYDEIEKTVLATVFTENVEFVETISWIEHNNTASFKNMGVKIPNDFWVLPRPLNENIIEL